mgnify:FL=1
MNPPFYVTEESFQNHIDWFKLTGFKVENDRRITYDEGGKLHDNFIENFEKHLTPNGRIVFLEDGRHYNRKLLEDRLSHLESQFEQFYIKDKEGDYYTLTYFM